MANSIRMNQQTQNGPGLARQAINWLVRATVLCTLTLSLSCASSGLEPAEVLPTDLPETWSDGGASDTLPISGHLLDLIDSDPLKLLVAEALAKNLNLRATAQRLKAAGFLLREPRSRLLPAVGATFSPGRNNQGIDRLTGREKTVDLHRMSLGISWELDIWGRLSDEYTASKYAVRTQDHEYRQARDALAARVIQAWIEQASIQSDIAIEQKRLAVLQHISFVLVERYKNGIGNLDELATARSRMELARADLSERRYSHMRVLRELEVMLGRFPEGDLMPQGGLPEVDLPPIDVPASVMLKRPDVLAAIARMEEARFRAKASAKELLPKLNLIGDIFRQSAHFSSLGSTTTYWSAVGSLFQPLFEGGRIISASRARNQEAHAALLDLHEAVLKAFKEVEDVVDRERDLERQLRALRTAVHESERSSQYYDQRYRQGIDTLQSLLIAREQEMAVNLRLNAAIAQRLVNRVDIAIALGAGLSDPSRTIKTNGAVGP